MQIRPLILCAALLSPALATFTTAHAQTAAIARPTPLAATAPTAVPTLVPYAGFAAAADGKPLIGDTSFTFMLFKDQQGGEPLWVESQMVAIDGTGHYGVQLGASAPSGLPLTTFASGEGRWLEIQIAGQPQQPRVLLMSVPYAMKAADTAMLGGLPATAYALAGTAATPSAALQTGPDRVAPDSSSTVTTPGGTSGYLPVFTAPSVIGNSVLFQSGSSLGIGTKSPAAILDVNGMMDVRGLFTLENAGVATASVGQSSQPLAFHASSYNSSTKNATSPTFEFKAEPVGNNTAAPLGTLNLLFTNGGTPAETGFYINPNGTVHFASGQTFGATSSSGVAFNGTSTSGTGVEGTSSSGTAVLGASTSAAGVRGTSSSNVGVSGSSTSGSGIVGYTAGNTLGTAGTLGIAGSRTSYNGVAGVWGDSAAHVGVFGSSNEYPGVLGSSVSGNGVHGISTNTSGIYGETSSGSSGDAAMYGYSHTSASGVVGISTSGTGGNFTGGASGGTGVEGTGGNAATDGNLPGWGGIFYGGAATASGSANGGIGVYAVGGSGGNGYSSGIGVEGSSGYSDAADGDFGGAFYGGGSNTGLAGSGIYAAPGYSSSNGYGTYAGDFGGDVYVSGTLSASVKNFKIDDPSDPANKYLVHASVESSELMDIYTGNVTTDELGLATITLPTWFQTLNTDFRYQLTVIGGRFAQAIVSKEIEKNQFSISTNASGVKVSWQVTAVRQDAYAKAHPLVVEQAKPARERGFYLHPELYGQPSEKQTEWATHAPMMRRLQAARTGAKPTAPSPLTKQSFLK